MPSMPRIARFQDDRTAGRTSSVELVERCLSRIADPTGEGARTFLRSYGDRASVAARAMDSLLESGYAGGALTGVPVSIKDLLDVAGEVTCAASQALSDAPPAGRDAPAVRRLKEAGAVLLGRTNMTPFAYSLVGLNPHFGTPGNPWDRSRIPGGSSSGAAVSVADGMSSAAIGSDTVGSIRVPAALCGVVGFKPTQKWISRVGSIPLSPTLDCIGPIAATVDDCATVFEVLAGFQVPRRRRASLAGTRLATPRGVFLEGLDHHVASAFDRATRRLTAAGAILLDQDFPVLSEVVASDGTRTIQSVEAYAWHRDLLARRGELYDMRIKARIEAGRDVPAADYAVMRGRQTDLTDVFDRQMAECDALILPTVPTIAPTFAEAEQRESEVRNQLMRNTAPFNFLDCPAMSVPVHEAGAAPVGLMVVGRQGADWHLLGIARFVEAAVSPLWR